MKKKHMPVEINRHGINPGDRTSIIDCCVNKDMFSCRGNGLNPDSQTCIDAISDIDGFKGMNPCDNSHVCKLRDESSDGIHIPIGLNKADSDLLELHTKSVTGSSHNVGYDCKASSNSIMSIIIIILMLIFFIVIPSVILYIRKKSSNQEIIDISTVGNGFPF
jgi:hypothetical protein